MRPSLESNCGPSEREPSDPSEWGPSIEEIMEYHALALENMKVSAEHLLQQWNQDRKENDQANLDTTKPASEADCAFLERTSRDYREDRMTDEYAVTYIQAIMSDKLTLKDHLEMDSDSSDSEHSLSPIQWGEVEVDENVSWDQDMPLAD